VAEHGLAVVMLQVLVQAHTGTVLAKDARAECLIQTNGLRPPRPRRMISE
jgi:hypothetical protein